MTDLQQLIRDGRDLLEKAEPGVWSAKDDGDNFWLIETADGLIGDLFTEPTASFIAWSRNALPALLDALEAYKRVADAARELSYHPLFPRRDDAAMGQATGSVWRDLNALRDALAALPATTEGES